MTTTAARGLSPVRKVLPNDCVALAQESFATPAVTINATLHTGSVVEPAAALGLAYFTSRVIDRGTERWSAADIAETLDGRGVTLNVAATRHTFSIICTCLAEDFEAILALVAEVICRPIFPHDQIELRRAEVITQLRQDEDNPAARAVETMFALLYANGHPYGRPAKGTVPSIERLDRATVAGFHRQWFRPDLLSVAVVGAVEAKAAVDQVARAFGDWRHPPVDGDAAATIAASLAAVDPPRDRCRKVIPMMAKAQADIAYGFVTIARTDPSYYAWWVMNTVLGQYGLGGRLGDNIRERQGMAYYVYSAFDPHVIPGPLMIRAGVDGGNVDRTIAAIDQEIATLAANGPSAQELEETQRYLIGSLPRMLETNGGIATFLQVAERFDLGLDYDRRLPDLVGRVTRESAHAAAAMLSPARAAIAIAGPYDEQVREG